MRIENKDLAISLKPQEPSSQTVKKACQDFEAFFLGFVFKKAFQPLFTSSSSPFFSQEETWFREMWVDEITKKVEESGGWGISDMLYQRLVEESKGDFS
ncbi:MAG: Rod binding protein [Candidatus Atribacteria bacterium]|nr:Rod binding protein [Candidatus Atribacteria bacterium]